MTQLALQRSFPDEQVLLHELDHRVNNEFACPISAVSRAAARTKNDEVKGALNAVAELLHRYADVHRALRIPEHDTLIGAAAYVRQLCLSISRSNLDYREIRLVLVARSQWLESDGCWRVGVIMHELINNAARHAFARGKGKIRVELARAGAFVECRVLDNGAAAGTVHAGRGLKIINELSKCRDDSIGALDRAVRRSWLPSLCSRVRTGSRREAPEPKRRKSPSRA